MKTNKILYIGVILLISALITKIVVNEYEIIEYKSQIDDLRGHIRYSIVADSILGAQKDSLGRSYYVVYKDDYGNNMTYREMIKTIEAQERLITVQDIVIQQAKEYFKFNYSVKDSCGTIHTRFWRKEGKPIE